MLRTASFGQVFATAFVVNALFHVAMGLIGVATAFAAPTNFNANGVATQSAGAALGVVAVMLIVATVINAASSALGTVIWFGVRRLLPGRDPSQAF